MNKLINTWNRGFSLKNDDIRFIDDSVRTAISDLAKAFNNKGATILWGCEVTIESAVATVAEGAIFYLDEIWHVTAHNFSVPVPIVDSPRWCFVTSWDASGAKTDADLQPHQAYQLRYAIGSMAEQVNQVASVFMESTTRLSEMNNSEVNLTLTGSTNRSGRVKPSRAVKRGDMVTIDAGLTVLLLDAAWLPVATVPGGLGPTELIEGSTAAYDNADPINPHVSIMYKIETSGVISVKKMVSSGQLMAVTFNLNLPAYCIK